MPPFLTLVFGRLLGAKWWLLAIAVTAAASYGIGYIAAQKHSEGVLADKVMEGYARGVEAQRKFDEKDRQDAREDAAKREAANETREAKLREIIATLPTLVPRNAACKLSVDAVKRLNEVAK
jgi:hypothetical protein